LALDQITSKATHLSQYKDDADKCRDSPSQHLQPELASLAVKTHFLLLKVNFELFLNRIIYWACDRHFGHLVQSKGFASLLDAFKKTLDIEDFVNQIAHNTGKEYVLETMVPAQGLDRFTDILKKGFNISMPGVVGESYHSQIYCAFEVRHLIEHRNGKVDGRFKRNVARCWRKSSWHDVSLEKGSRLDIRQGDFDSTFEAMLHGVHAIGESVERYEPKKIDGAGLD